MQLVEINLIQLKMPPKIIHVDYGVANNFGSHIEINKDLLKDKKLYDYVLKHEFGHHQEDYDIKDLKNDFKIRPKMILKLMWFVLIRPKTWIEFSPIYKRDGKIIFDKGMLISYCILISLIILALAIFF